MTPVQTILEILDTASPTPRQCEEIVNIINRYPYFTAAAAVAVSRCTAGIDPLLMKQLAAKSALGAPDRLAFYRLVEPSVASHSSFYPPLQAPKVTTESAIDTFLDTYGAPIPPEEQAMLEKLIFNPTADYSSVMQKEQRGERPKAVDRQDELLDAFLARTARQPLRISQSDSPLASNAPLTDSYGDIPVNGVENRPDGSTDGNEESTPTRKTSDEGGNDLSNDKPKSQQLEKQEKPTVAPQSQPSSLLSESLARIYIKRGRYDKAYEIIHNLSLNFPEKSIYFADQLRFLQKLMVNSKYSNPQK